MDERTELKLSEAEKKRIDAEIDEKANETESSRTPSEEERKFVRLAVERYNRYHEQYSDEIKLAKDDIDFCVNGNHWVVDGKDTKAERDADNRLSFTKNRAPGFIDNVTGDVRQNMPRIKFRPADSNTDPKLALIYNAAINYMQSISRAHRQYIPAFEQACTAGYPGWCQLQTVYATDDPLNDEQDIIVKFVPSQFGPALDHTGPILDEPGRGGPKWGVIPEEISWADYQDRFPEASVQSWEAVKDEGNSWYRSDGIMIASYYNATPERKEVVKFDTGEKFVKGSDEHKAFIKANPEAKAKFHREVTTWKIDHYLINGSEILAGPEPWDGKFIPLIPFEGKWFMSDGKKKYRSVYRHAKDANRLENWVDSTIAELMADEPYIGSAEQVEENEDMWKTRNKKKYGYLPAKPDQKGRYPAKEDNSQKLNSAFAMKKHLVDDVKSLTNVYNASRGEEGNETSGRAINARDAQSNTTNFAFNDNGIVSPLEYIAMQFVDLFPKKYDYEKTLKIIGDDDREDGTVTLNKMEPGSETPAHVFKDKKGNVTRIYSDLSHVRFDISVDVGPGLKTQRMEAADQMIQLAQGNQLYAEVSGDVTAKMMDHQYADKIGRRYEFILGQKYPGIEQAEEGEEASRVQMAVKQAVDQFKQQLMPQMQQMEANVQKQVQTIQEQAQAIAQLQSEKDAATKLMKDKTAEIELKQREMSLKEREFDLKERTESERARFETDKAPLLKEINELTAQVAALAESIEAMQKQHEEAIAAIRQEKSRKWWQKEGKPKQEVAQS